MKESEITALAREFSKEHDDSTIAYHAAKDVINFLLRRYCLVEKSKVSEMYDVAMKVSRLPKSVEARGYAISRLQTLESLFPEIAKEGEG